MPSFPIVLVKTESDFIFRSVETGLGRLTLMVAVVSVDAYPFLAFSDLNLAWMFQKIKQISQHNFQRVFLPLR